MPTQLFLELCPCPIVGVTGSSGKSTTTTLIAEIARAGGRRVGLGGNIGRPMLDLLGEVAEKDLAVVEMSSFQLARVTRSPHLAVITNLSPNHLDRHGSMVEYSRAKRNVLAYQSSDDFVVANRDDTSAWELSEGGAGTRVGFGWARSPETMAFVDGRVIMRLWHGQIEAVLDLDSLRLPGRHNVSNALAAVAASTLLDLPADSVREVLTSFRGLAPPAGGGRRDRRCELCG